MSSTGKRETLAFGLYGTLVDPEAISAERSLDGFAGGPVAPDAGGHGQQPLRDPGVDACGGAAVVPFQVQLALVGVVDRLDPLPDPPDRPVPGCLVAQVRAAQAQPDGGCVMGADGSVKITYTVTEVTDDHLHRQFDDAVSSVRSRLGQQHPFYVAGAARSGSQVAQEVAPGDQSVVVGFFDEPNPDDVDDAVRAAVAGFRSWSRMAWQDRVAILERAAAEVAERRFELAALLTIEIGKPRLEALGDVDDRTDHALLLAGQGA